MDTHTFLTLLIGGFGGIGADLLAIKAALMTGKELARSRRGSAQVIGLSIGALIGAVVVLIYQKTLNQPVPPILALHLGASAPLLIQQMAKITPPITGPSSEGIGSNPIQIKETKVPALEQVRRFLAGVEERK